MKKFGKIIRWTITSLLLLYALLIVFLHLPFVQKALGNYTASLLSERLGTEVNVGKVNLGLLNRILIDDISIADQQGQPLCHVARSAVSLNPWNLLHGNYNINTVQLFGADIHLNRQTADAPLNCQFIIDALASDDEKEKESVAFNVNTLLLRHVNVTYDVLDEARRDSVFDANHLDVKNLALTAAIKHQGEDWDVNVKRLDFAEKNSGLALKKFAAHVGTDGKTGTIAGLKAATEQSSIDIPEVNFALGESDADKFSVDATIDDSHIVPAEFSSLYPALQNYNEALSLTAQKVHATPSELSVTALTLRNDDESLLLQANASAENLGQDNAAFSVDDLTLKSSAAQTERLLALAPLDPSLKTTLTNLGDISVKGNASRADQNLVTELELQTSAGNANVSGAMTSDQRLTAHVEAEQLQLAKLLDSNDFGTASFTADVDELDWQHGLSAKNVRADIQQFDFKDYSYQNATAEGSLSDGIFDGNIRVDDPNADLSINGKIGKNEQQFLADAALTVNRIVPNALNLAQLKDNPQLTFSTHANLQGSSLRDIVGDLRVDSLLISTNKENYRVKQLAVNCSQQGGQRLLQLDGDFIHASMDGNMEFDELAETIQQQLSPYLPALAKRQSSSRKSNNHCAIDLTLSDSPILHQFVDEDFALTQPISLHGQLNAASPTRLTLSAPAVQFSNRDFENIECTYLSNANEAEITGSLTTGGDDKTQITFDATGKNNQLHTLVGLKKPSAQDFFGQIATTTAFARTPEGLSTTINIHPSDIVIRDTNWHISPATVQIVGKEIACNNVEISHEARHLRLNGLLSAKESNLLVAELQDIDLQYLMNFIDIGVVSFQGVASGKAYISNVYTQPDFSADLQVDDFAFITGSLGHANIHANWDNVGKQILLSAHITDTDEQQRPCVTDCNGFVSPANNDINLEISTQNSNAAFLNQFLGKTFENINGRVNGKINVIGPLNDINIVGDVLPDVQMKLRATGVTYCIPPIDSIQLRPYQFNFNDIHLKDLEGNTGLLSGVVRHKNMKGFKYNLALTLQQMLLYDTPAFTDDKIMGKVYANGTLNIDGQDDHPLQLRADITPTKGSFFAYDAATPDAIVATSSFITIQDKNLAEEEETAEERPEKKKAAKQNYTGDIYMNLSLHVNPDCAVKLRMDNAEDGYITTYGTGTLQANYHNKSPFRLNGTYNILGGSYRLYLQDIIYRDLQLQQGSSVVFNGDPFNAKIHLICHHTLNSVPLTDLTANAAYNANNRVKVICILDITGQLGDMNLNFDFSLPNVTDETRQLVRSLISTEEEMNMQMIYLLTVGRFYTNEYSRANTTAESTSTSAMNSLLSSTISGQINQMLSNVIGTNSNWNIGTGLSTGEQGWQDLDIEGILSGRLLDDRLLINGNFGYRDNALTQNASFIGDFDVKYRLTPNGPIYLKAYNKANDRYFTKSTINTQGIGITYQKDFETWGSLLRKTRKKTTETK